MKNLKKIISILMVTIMLSLTCSVAFAQSDSKEKPIVYTAPATGSTMNGIQENQLIQPMSIIGYPIFVDYIPGTYAHNNFFKLIARTSFDNRIGTSTVPLTLNITNSTSQGSEWSTSISVTAEFKVAFLAKLSATIGGGYKETRTTNEAVGASSTILVPAGQNKGVEAYWGGENTNGTVKYKYVDTGSESGYSPIMSTSLGAYVHTTYFDVHFRPYNP